MLLFYNFNLKYFLPKKMKLVITDQHLDLYSKFLNQIKKENNIKLIIILTYTIDPLIVQAFQKKTLAHIIVIYGSHGIRNCKQTNPTSTTHVTYLKSHPRYGRMHAKAFFLYLPI